MRAGLCSKGLQQRVLRRSYRLQILWRFLRPHQPPLIHQQHQPPQHRDRKQQEQGKENQVRQHLEEHIQIEWGFYQN